MKLFVYWITKSLPFSKATIEDLYDQNKSASYSKLEITQRERSAAGPGPLVAGNGNKLHAGNITKFMLSSLRLQEDALENDRQ